MRAYFYKSDYNDLFQIIIYASSGILRHTFYIAYADVVQIPYIFRALGVEQVGLGADLTTEQKRGLSALYNEFEAV